MTDSWPPGRQFVWGAIDEFARVDPARQLLDEAQTLARAGHHDQAYTCLRDGLLRMGRWREPALATLVGLALASRQPAARLSDDFAELIRLTRGAGASLLPVIDIFERAGHEERKELLFDHAGSARESSLADALAIERLETLAQRGQWWLSGPVLTTLAGKTRHRCLGAWQTARMVLFDEREPWSLRQVDGKLPLTEGMTALMGSLLELKRLRALASRPGAGLRLPRHGWPLGGSAERRGPASPRPHTPPLPPSTRESAAPSTALEIALLGSSALRPAIEAWCRPGCPLLEALLLWADAALLIAGHKSPRPQADIVAALTNLATAARPTLGCRNLREGFVRRRIDSQLRDWSTGLAADFGRPRPHRVCHGGVSAPHPWQTLPASLLRGRAISVGAFGIATRPVSRAEFATFDPGVSLRPGDEHRPMTGVTWFQANAFARACGGRLPGLAEWLVACRAGLTAPGHLLAAGGTPWFEWSADWTLTGAERVRLSLPVSPDAAALPMSLTSGPASEQGLPPMERDPQTGFRVVV